MPWGMITVDMVALDHLPDTLHREFAAAFPGRSLLGAWLYGSHAHGRSRAGSDLDIAVLCDAALDPVTLFDTSSRLAALLGTSVDLVDLRSASGLLRVEATHRSRALVPPTTAAEAFCAHALADHAAFAPNRRAATAALQEKFRAR
jgi:predicted nucleotidyltransferase